MTSSFLPRSIFTFRTRNLLNRKGLLRCTNSFNKLQFNSIHLTRPINGLVDFKLADIGEGIAEVEILQWFVKEGEEISEFDPLCSVQSDKATVEITSRYDGKIAALPWAEGDMAKVGMTLVTIETDDDDDEKTNEKSTPSVEPPSEPVQKETQNVDAEKDKFKRQARLMEGQSSYSIEPTLSPTGSSSSASNSYEMSSSLTIDDTMGRVLTTPAVRRLAKEHSLDLGRIRGTGKNGRILKEDVLSFINSRSSTQESTHEEPERVLSRTGDMKEVSVSSMLQPRERLEDERVELKGIVRLMHQTMTASLQVPHFNYMDEYEVKQLADLRKRMNANFGTKLSFMPIILKAISIGLKEFPIINSHLKEDHFIMKKNHDLGVAMDTPRGLLVPVVRNCEQKSIMEISDELKHLQSLGAENKLGENELKAPTFTVSNIGSIGGTYMSPVVAVPQVGIVAIGKIQEKLVMDGESLAQTQVMNFSYAADHRVVDGATVARFSNRVQSLLREPESLLLHLK